MIVWRIIGWVMVLAGLSVLAHDVIAWRDTRIWAPVSLGQLWYELDRPSLNLVQAATERYLSPLLWDPVIVSLLLCWAFAIFLVVGGTLLLCFRKRRSRRS